MGWASGLVDSGARVDSITLLSFELLGKVTVEKKRVSQAFRQKKIHYRKKERRKEGKKERKKERKERKKETGFREKPVPSLYSQPFLYLIDG